MATSLHLLPLNAITCDNHRKALGLLKVLACVDVIFLMFLTQQLGHEFGGNLMHFQIVIQNTLNNPEKITNVLATLQTMILLYSRTNSFT
jgi:hypothetical protein